MIREASLPESEVERLSGKPGGFIESDLVDPRYFSAANIKNRLESYFQMLEQKRLSTSLESPRAPVEGRIGGAA